MCDYLLFYLVKSKIFPEVKGYMSVFTKGKLMETPLLPTIIATLFFVILLGIGSFTDYQISRTLVNQDNWFGKFFETFGMLVAFSFIPGSGVLFFKGFYSKNTTVFKILGIVLLIATIVCGTILTNHYIGPSKASYGFRLANPWGYIISALFMLLFVGIYSLIVKSDDQNKMIRIAIVILAAMLIQWGLIEILKKFNGRPRYRYLISTELNSAGEEFRNWWIFKPGSAIDDAHKSWPSGHSGTTVQTILFFPLLYPILGKQNKSLYTLLFALGPIYHFFMIFGRIYTGAHFLSDVSAGSLLGILSMLIPWILGDKLFKGKKPPIEEPPLQE